MITFSELLDKYITDSLSASELKAFTAMIAAGLYRDEFAAYIDTKAGTLTGEDNYLMELSYQALQAKIKAYEEEHMPAPVLSIFRRSHRFRVGAAAAILLILSLSGYFYFTLRPFDLAQGEMTQQQRFKNDAAPGGNKAILTLAGGRQIILDSAASGTLTQQGDTKIIKLDSGRLAYHAGVPNGEILYNTISTPNSGQYQVVLADGSKVWLNAASSIKFPAAFTGKERDVEMTGEAYFEIAPDASKPFNVLVNGMNVRVLGTHFNINAYPDEPGIKTTLLQGSIRASTAKGQPVFIKPGQQAVLNASGRLSTLNDIDMDETIAWKNGVFRCDNSDIETVMRQISRWYDVDIVYEKPIAKKVSLLSVPRSLTMTGILKILEMTGNVKFMISGRKVTVI